MNYFIQTFGCQMNEADSEKIDSILKSAGNKRTDLKSANFVFVNMCSVRQSAVDRIYGLAMKLKKLKAKTVLTGCVLPRDKRKLDFDMVLTLEEISKVFKGKTKDVISANIPIMTGCNNFCSYCVVPYVRGREVSRKKEEIICEVKKAIKNGLKEIWLLGQNVNSFKGFPELLKEINNIPGNFWVRFTSSHPKDFSDKLIKAMKGDKITPYLNLPVQAGDDKVLKSMNRHYTIKHYKSLIDKVRKEIPNITISTDIIVGFPGETKKQFQNSIKLFKDIKYDMAYISEYSPRKGTAAFLMEDNVSKEEKANRKRLLNDVLEKTALEKNKAYIGKTVEVLNGKTKEYKTIYIKTKKNILNKFVKAKVTNATPWKLEGKLL